MFKKWLIVLGLVVAPCIAAPRALAVTDDVDDAAVTNDESDVVGEPDLTNGEWKTEIDYDSQLFPSLIIATASVKVPQEEGDENENTLGDSQGLIGIAIGSPRDGAKIRVAV